MNKSIAINIAEKELNSYMGKEWSELKDMIGSEPLTYEITGEDSKEYNIEVLCFWDDKKNEDIRVIVSVDDGGWRVHFPISTDDIKKKIEPDG